MLGLECLTRVCDGWTGSSKKSGCRSVEPRGLQCGDFEIEECASFFLRQMLVEPIRICKKDSQDVRRHIVYQAFVKLFAQTTHHLINGLIPDL